MKRRARVAITPALKLAHVFRPVHRKHHLPLRRECEDGPNIRQGTPTFVFLEDRTQALNDLTILGKDVSQARWVELHDQAWRRVSGFIPRHFP